MTVVPAETAAEDILALKPDGVFLSNGPGDPAATGEYAVPVIKKLINSGTPTFGICLGHQMLGIALGGKTMKMHQGHHGANHPVKDLTTGKVEITSMNHGFAVDKDSLPKNVEQTHVSLFDGSNCGIALKDRPVFSVQYHPEASPGPRDSHYLFTRFVDLMRSAAKGIAQAVFEPLDQRTAMRATTSRSSRCASCSPTTASCPTIRACRSCLSRRHRPLGTPDPGSRDREDVPRQRLGRHVAQRHLSLRALPLDDPRGHGHRARPRQGALRRQQGQGDRDQPGDVAVLPAGTGHQCLWASPDLW